MQLLLHMSLATVSLCRDVTFESMYEATAHPDGVHARL